MNTNAEISTEDKKFAAELQNMSKQYVQNFITVICDRILPAHAKNINPYGDWKKESNAKITTYTYRGTEEEKVTGKVGTNGKIIVKIKDKNTPDGLKTEYFFERGNSIAAAMHYYIAKNFFNIDTAKIRASISHYLNNYKIHIDQDCQLDPDQLYADQALYEHYEQVIKDIYIGDKNPDALKKLYAAKDELVIISKKRSKYGAHIVAIALKHQQKLVTYMAQLLVDFHNGLNTYISLEEAIKLLQQAEKLNIKETGRPHIIKLTHLENGKWRLSAQLTLGEITVPSSIRNFVGIPSNFVQQCDGYVIEGKTILTDINLRHSSLPTIEIDDEISRRYNAYLAARYVIETAAKNILKSNHELKSFHKTLGNQEYPIVIQMASVLALTPIHGKHTEQTIRGKESEHGQLNDTRWAIKLLLHGAEQPLKLNIDGRNVYVKLTYKFLNLPVNIADLMVKASKSPLEKNINAEWGYHYFSEMNEFFTNFSLSDFNLPQGVSEHIKISIDQLKFIFQIQSDNNENLPTYPSKKYKKYLTLLEKITYQSNNNYKKLTNKKNSIRSSQNKNIYAFCKEKMKALKNIYKSNKNKISEINTSIKCVLEKMHKNKKSAADIQAIKNFLKILQAHLILTETYLSGRYKSSRYLYVVLAFYLKIKQSLGYLTSGNCKSCEDRGGFLRVFLMALDDFFDSYGYFPNPNDDYDWTIFQAIFIPDAEKMSTSHENTGFNASGSQGLQVSGEMRGLFSRKEDVANAKTAKSAYKSKTLHEDIKLFTPMPDDHDVVINMPEFRDNRRHSTATAITVISVITLILVLTFLILHLKLESNVPLYGNIIIALTLLFSLNLIYKNHQDKKKNNLIHISDKTFLNIDNLLTKADGKVSFNEDNLNMLVRNLITYHHDSESNSFSGYLTFASVKKIITVIYFHEPKSFINLINPLLKRVLHSLSGPDKKYQHSQEKIAQYIITASLLQITKTSKNRKNKQLIKLLRNTVEVLQTCRLSKTNCVSILANAVNYILKPAPGFWSIFKQGTSISSYLHKNECFNSVTQETARLILHSENDGQAIIDQLTILSGINDKAKDSMLPIIAKTISKQPSGEFRYQIMSAFDITQQVIERMHLLA